MEEKEYSPDPQLVNPYMTPEPHPLLQLAYDLGLLAVESVQRHSNCEKEVLSRKHAKSEGIKKSLCDLSRIVCYVVKKSWLKSETVLLSASSKDEGKTNDSVKILFYAIEINYNSCKSIATTKSHTEHGSISLNIFLALSWRAWSD